MKSIMILLFVVLNFSVFSQVPEEILLYQGKAPGSENWDWKQKEEYSDLFKTEVVYNVAGPSVLVFRPEKTKNTGTAVLIAPGGGFLSLSINREGTDLAKRLSSEGITAFVLKYRLLKCDQDPAKTMIEKLKDREAFEKETEPIVRMDQDDAVQAIRYIRSHAREYGINKDKVGAIGFSAGGTVVLSTLLGNENVNDCPDFAAALYTGSHNGILDRPVPGKKVPLFICGASDDQLKLTPKSILLYTKWYEAGYPVELHIYSTGGHGFGMGKQNLPVDTWIDRYEDWLKQNGFL